LYGTTGPESRDDCSRKRSGVGIAANLRAARRRRPSRVASVGQDPNSAAPVAHLSYLHFPDRKRDDRGEALKAQYDLGLPEPIPDRLGELLKQLAQPMDECDSETG